MGPGNPSQQGSGGMAPPMNPMQKSGVQGMPQPMPKPGGNQGFSPGLQSFQGFESNQADRMQGFQDVRRLEDQLRQAVMSGENPMVIAGLQSQLQRLQQQQQQSAQGQMLDSRQQAYDQERRASAPGVGGASNPNVGAYASNSAFDQQLLGLLLGGGGMGGPGGPGGPVG